MELLLAQENLELDAIRCLFDTLLKSLSPIQPNENGQEVQHTAVSVQPVQSGVSALPQAPWPGAQMTPFPPLPSASDR